MGAIMLEDVRRLKLNELENELNQLQQQYAAMFAELNNLNAKLWNLRRYAKKGIKAYDGKKKFTFLERFITARKDYRAYQAALAKLDRLPERIARLNRQVIMAEQQTAKQVASSGIENSIAQIEKEIIMVKNARTLDQLGVSAVEAVTMLQNNGITPYWNEDDYESFKVINEHSNSANLLNLHETVSKVFDNYLDNTQTQPSEKSAPDEKQL